MKEKRSERMTWILFAAALCMCVFGAVNGEMQEVFMKAVKICMECIGLG